MGAFFLKNRPLAVLITVLMLLITSSLFFGSYKSANTYGKVNSTTDDMGNLQWDINDGAGISSYDNEESIINILLLGVDGFQNKIRVSSKDSHVDSRSDTIIIGTIDKKSKKIKLTSVMRDLWVPIHGYKSYYNKINAAYALGGIEGALATVNENFGLDIKYYATVNFAAFQELVDIIDGIEVEVKDYEVDEINKYIKDVNGEHSTYIPGPGFQKLNGQQALSYSRIRKVGNNDYERTERQRRVISKIFGKLKSVSILKIPDIIGSLMSNVYTNIPLSQVMDLAFTAYRFSSSDMETIRIPVDGYFRQASVDGAFVLKADIKKNKQLLHSFIYNNN